MNSSLPSSLDVVTFGDLNLDWVVDGNVDFRWTDVAENGRTALGAMRELPGGSAFNFARFAKEAGLSAGLGGVVGRDVAGVTITTELERLGIHHSVRIDPDRKTGCCFIARDAADVRLLFNAKENANHALAAQDIDRVIEGIRSAKILYVSGFCVREPSELRYGAVRRLFERFPDKDSSPLQVFDVVPHRIYEKYSWTDFREITSSAAVLISEVATMRRFLSIGHPREFVDGRLAKETAQALRPYFQRMILRYGPSGCDDELLWDESTRREAHHATGHASASDKRGFGDKMAIRALTSFFRLL